MKTRRNERWGVRGIAALCMSATIALVDVHAGDGDWTVWRGPQWNGVSEAVGLPESWSPKGENLIWKREEYATRSTPVVMNGRLYTVCRANPETTQEGEKVVCLDAATGEMIWETFNNVYLSDAPAERVGWSSVVADHASGNVYVLGLGSLFQCLNGETGEVLWQRSMIEEFGMLSTYGGRTNFPIVFEDLVIISGVTTGWGDEAIPAHRFFGMDKMTGEVVWLTSTRLRPEDTTYSTPVVTRFRGQDAIVFGGGDGAVYAIQPRTGKVIWKYEVSVRGINQTPLVVDGKVYCGHSEKNVADTTILGAFFALDGEKADGEIKESDLLWKLPAATIGRSAPLYIDGRIYAVDDGATLHVIDAESGRVIEEKRLGRIMFGSLVYGDGKIYMGEATGRFYILRPTEEGVEVVHQTRLNNEEILGSPIIADGRVYLPTIGALYCLGTGEGRTESTRKPMRDIAPLAGPMTQVRIAPARGTAVPGGEVPLKVIGFDAKGFYADAAGVTLSIEGSAKLEGETLKIGADAGNTVIKVSAKGADGTVVGTAQIRVLPPLPLRYDFENGVIPPTWVGCNYRHKPFEIDGQKVLVKVSTIPKGTRSQGWIGPIDLKNYTISGDFLATKQNDQLPDMGLVNSRYTVSMIGTQQLQIRSWVSRLELRFAKTIPFTWTEGVWYTIKFRSEVKGDRILLQAKVWPRDEAEPAEWTIEAEDLTPNTHGAPGVFGVSSNAEFYLDNLVVNANDAP